MRAPVPGPSRFFILIVFLLSLLSCAQLALCAARPAPTPEPSILEVRTQAESGDIAAQIQLSELLLLGDPADKRFPVALAWAQQAAAGNSSRAEFVMGYLYEHGRGVTQDYALSAKYYEAASMQGHRIAPNNLALLYSRGLGVPRDPNKAFELVALSAQRGDPGAQFNLAVAYYRGVGTARDLTAAAHWFRAAAEKGFAQAQRELGVMYFKGESVPLDYGQGAHWITLAAQQGEPSAETDLGFLCETGRGVALDYIAAYSWYSRAATAGNRSAAEHLKNLMQIMTRQQVERAKAIVFAESSTAAVRTGVDTTGPTFLPEP